MVFFKFITKAICRTLPSLFTTFSTAVVILSGFGPGLNFFWVILQSLAVDKKPKIYVVF